MLTVLSCDETMALWRFGDHEVHLGELDLRRGDASLAATIKRPITVSVMGCVVNGPGEGQHADIGIAGGKGKGILFKHGKIVGTFPEKELVPALLRELDIIAAEDNAQKLAS